MSYKPFRYFKDPLYLFCVAFYLVNRFGIKPNCDVYFFHAWLNDFICIPFIVPPMLWLLRVLQIRRHDLPPTLPEIVIPLVIISWTFEIFLPQTERFGPYTVADPYDMIWYSLGAALSGLFWMLWYRN